MNSIPNVWSSSSYEKQIIYLVCYASVFRTGISIAKISEILGLSGEKLNPLISYLIDRKIVAIKNECLVDPEVIKLQDDGSRKMTDPQDVNSIIQKKMPYLNILAKLPMIKFIGISGSIAAGNPVLYKKRVDLDLFIITSKNTLWTLAFFTRIYSSSKMNYFIKHPLCFNYILDESFLEIHNQNFYTATEMINLIPVHGMATYNDFLSSNSWIYKFYPNFSPKTKFKLS